MPGSGTAEVYFIAAMMVLIFIVCVAAMYAFFKTYRKEMREREAEKARRLAEKAAAADDKRGDDAR